ncbi:hypothetical protein BSL78_06552 [Apostichopus japonicus]|uniref:Uncharacterized protein n=1 Tax=Stichopus japonicus TaxID=307972 RepID=A0A2G8L8L5_STIJA|nr:hypothetical protein BSL78_06552 [Apostichopus japonicus]
MSIFDPSETPKPLQLEQFSSMESLSSSHSGTSFSGMSLSAMSASSIISSHSLRGNVGASLENKISRSIVKSVKEGRKSFNTETNASTPKSTDKSQPHVTFQAETSVSENLDFSPVTSSPGPVSRGGAQNRDLPRI